MIDTNYSPHVGRTPKPTPNERAEWVRRVRLSEKLSQELFAEAIGADRATVSNWERGRYVPEWASIEKITQRFPKAPRPPFGQTDEMSDPGSTVPPTETPTGGQYIVKTDQGRIIAKMIDAIEDETARTDAMLACAAELKKNPHELGADKRPDRAQRNK